MTKNIKNRTDNIVFVPLDSRPVSTRLPESLGGLCGWNMVMPPKSLLGGLHAPAKIPEIQSWLLEKALPEAGALYVALDLLIYGGLVFSRDSRTTLGCALANLAFLRKIKASFPNLEMFIFDVILRDSITVRTKEDFELWDRLQSGVGEYPDWFMEIRKRNHRINEELLGLVSEGVVDYALLGKEDTAPTNPFAGEIKDLKKIVGDLGIEKKATVINGTDELPLLLMARSYSLEKGIAPKFFVDQSADEFLETTPIFESQPLKKTLIQQTGLVGGEITRDTDYDIRLIIHPPKRTQLDMFALQIDWAGKHGNEEFATTAPYGTNYYDGFIKTVQDEPRLCAIADLSHANGADPMLAERLLEAGLFFVPAAYAGWNTASNTLGTVVAFSSVVNCIRKTQDADDALVGKHAIIVLERLMDDCFYQTIVRGELALATKQPHAVENPDRMNSILRTAIKNKNADIFKRFFNKRKMRTCMLDNGQIEITRLGQGVVQLPWNRLFEAEFVPEIECRIVRD